VGVVLLPLFRAEPRPALSRWAVMLAAFAITMLPWFTYNYVNFGRFTLSPAGGIGRGIWEGSWQGYWSGRVQSELTDLADRTPDRTKLDTAVRAVAAREHLDPLPMLAYTHQEQDIRRIWTEPQDPMERTRARVEADNEYLRVGLANSAHDRLAHLRRRLSRGLFVLWAADIPVRYTQINELPTAAIRAMWLAQAALLLLAAVGLIALVLAGRVPDALVLAAPILYVTAVHFPLLTEARQSLPAKPVLLVLAVVGARSLAGRSFPLEAQVHERQHL